MVGSIGNLLWEARTTGTKLDGDFCGAPTTEGEAYSLQSEMIVASGEKLIGWKIGATAEALFGVLGVSGPFVGPLFDRFTYSNADTVVIQPGNALETEITIRVKADMPSRKVAYNRDEILNAVDNVYASFEVVGARFEGDLAGAGCRLIADGGANVATVLGEEIQDWRKTDFQKYPISLFINDELIKEGSPSVLLWEHIFDSVSWLAAHSALAERGLKSGDIIMTGTCTGISPLNPGDRAEAHFGGIAKISASFVYS